MNAGKAITEALQEQKRDDELRVHTRFMLDEIVRIGDRMVEKIRAKWGDEVES